MPHRWFATASTLGTMVGRPDCRTPFHARPLCLLALSSALAALALSSCGQAATNPSLATSSTTTPSAVTPPTVGSSTAKSRTPAKRAPEKRPHRATHTQAGLPYSTASAHAVQSQPAPGSCHAIGSGRYSRPDPHCTPGALNPAVTQATIDQTICQSGWTSTVRPPESITETEKAGSMAAYGDSGLMSAYEYDHFVPLELGGAVNDARNLWPEPGASPNPKDDVEDELRQKVCDEQMTLSQAQRAIATNWTVLARSPTNSGSTQAPSRSTTTVSAPTAGKVRCSLSASYSDRHHDYDVYVHSNQPDQTVTVTDTAGRSTSWHTDASGYADVYFRAPASARGETVTARVGGATCHTTL
jgi:hypothetical protein